MLVVGYHRRLVRKFQMVEKTKIFSNIYMSIIPFGLNEDISKLLHQRPPQRLFKTYPL